MTSDTPSRPPAEYSLPAIARHPVLKQVALSDEVDSTLLQGHSQPAALHVEDRFQVCIGRHSLDIIWNHIHIVRKDQPTRLHERQKLVQIIDVAALVGVDECNVDWPFHLRH